MGHAASVVFSEEHRYWSVVENRRCGRGKVVQLYSGNSFILERSTTVSAKAGAERSKSSMRSASGSCPWHYFPLIGSYPTSPLGLGLQVRLKEMELHQPREYKQLELDEFWAECLPDSREGTGGKLLNQN